MSTDWLEVARTHLYKTCDCKDETCWDQYLNAVNEAAAERDIDPDTLMNCLTSEKFFLERGVEP